MRTIIVATDYSESSEAAFRYAAFIARFTKADLALVNIYTFNIHALNGRINPAAMDELINSNIQRLEKYAGKLSSTHGVPLKSYCLTNVEEDTLKEFADKVNADLIVMGMRQNPEEHSLSGNISTSIIQNTKLPVLVVPEDATFKLPERLLYACDYQSLPEENHLRALKEIAAAFGAEIQILHISQPHDDDDIDFEVRRNIAGQLEASVSSFKHSYRSRSATDIFEGLKEGIKGFNADILVMSPHKYGFWNSLFHKSTTRKMALISPIPLLSVPS